MKSFKNYIINAILGVAKSVADAAAKLSNIMKSFENYIVEAILVVIFSIFLGLFFCLYMIVLGVFLLVWFLYDYIMLSIGLRGGDGLSALMLAAGKGNKGKVIKLLSSRKSIINEKDVLGETALHYSIRSGNHEIAILLIENGCDVNADSSTPPLILTCGTRSPCEIRSTCYSRLTSRKEDFKIVEQMIKHGVDVNKLTRAGGALHVVNNSEIAELLLNNDANIELVNECGKTPLHSACSGGKIEIVEVLIKNGANINATDNNGNSPLHSACSGGKIEIVEVLIKNGANINATDNNGNSALWSAIEYSVDDSVDACNCLVTNGVDVNIRNTLGETVLLNIVKNLDELAESRVPYIDGCPYPDPDLKNQQRDILVSLIKILINGGANVSLQDNEGKSALIYAQQNGQSDIVEILSES